MNKSQSVGMYIILGIMVLAFISMLFAVVAFAQPPSDNTVNVVYNGTSAEVSVADNIVQY